MFVAVPPVTYSITTVAGATLGYTWTVPAGSATLQSGTNNTPPPSVLPAGNAPTQQVQRGGGRFLHRRGAVN